MQVYTSFFFILLTVMVIIRIRNVNKLPPLVRHKIVSLYPLFYHHISGLIFHKHYYIMKSLHNKTGVFE